VLLHRSTIYALLSSWLRKPGCQSREISHVGSTQGVMWTCPLTSRSTWLIDTQITFCRLCYRRIRLWIEDHIAIFIAHFDHSDIVVGAVAGTGHAPDTRGIVNHNLPRVGIATNGTRWATNHTNRINTMHAGVCDHKMIEDAPMTN
jgi:hypothetical protein